MQTSTIVMLYTYIQFYTHLQQKSNPYPHEFTAGSTVDDSMEDICKIVSTAIQKFGITCLQL